MSRQSPSGSGAAQAAPERPLDARLTTGEIFELLWRERVLLIAIPVVITAAVAAAGFLIPARYEATVVMMPVLDSESPERSGGLGAAAASLGGLASIAGLSAGGNTLKTEALAILESEALTDRFISDNKLLPLLYRSKWDLERGQWKSADSKKWPTLWKANRYFKDIRNVTDNARSGLVTMTITWRDPVQAAEWANGLVAMTNQYIRDKAVRDAEKNIVFLKEQTKSNDIVPMQQAISNLTETQLKKIMYARGREEYALKVLDPATVSEKQSFPRPVLWTVSAAILGIFIGILAVLLRKTGREANLQSPGNSASLFGGE
jgi:uncharacterized protein involved in exopolysaccharide biosynthesis